jgi:hypothetical protein
MNKIENFLDIYLNLKREDLKGLVVAIAVVWFCIWNGWI